MILGLVVLSVVAIGWKFIKYETKVNEEEQYKILYTAAKSYLQSKYNEKMVTKEGYSYYDSVYRLCVYPEGREELVFRVEVLVAHSRLKDNYLSTCAGAQVTKAIQGIVDEKTENCIHVLAVLSSFKEAEEMLQEYYNLNQEPMGSYNEDMPSEIEWVVIYLNSKGEAEDYETVCSILKGIPSLSFTIEHLDFISMIGMERSENQLRITALI